MGGFEIRLGLRIACLAAVEPLCCRKQIASLFCPSLGRFNIGVFWQTANVMQQPARIG